MHIPGFESIAELELDDEPYSYNLIGLWRNAEGFFLGTDSGCSCPTPWESHTASDLTGPLDKGELDMLERLEKQQQLADWADDHGLRPDWHEPDEQNIDVRFVATTGLDNAMGTRNFASPDSGEVWIEPCLILTVDGTPDAIVNVADLFAWATQGKRKGVTS